MTPSLTSRQQLRSNKIFETIRSFELMFHEEFEKCGIKRCGHCKSTGFSDSNMTSLCMNCGGMGYVGFKKINGHFVCRTCNGYGCMLCDNQGYVDWVTHANGRDIKKDK